MFFRMHSVMHLVSALSVAVSLCSALELEEIRPHSIHGIGARSIGKRDLSVIDLKSTETFLWGAQDGDDATFGNLTVEMPGDQEGILSMERFDGMLTDVKCDKNGLSLTFEDDDTFAYAKKIWDWVNGAENHQFLMVAGKGDCGDNQNRVPYMVSKLAYDEGKNTAKLTAKTGEWKDLLHSYELHVGSVPIEDVPGLRRRDYTKDTSLNMGADFRSKVKVKTGPVTGELVCDPCYTAGQLKFEFIIKTKFLVPVGLEFRANPVGMKAQANLRFDIVSDFGTKANIGDTVSLGKIPLAGVSIPGNIFTLGPVIDFGAGVEVTGFEGRVSFQTGATATLPDNAILQADLFSPSNNKFSGWTPKFVTEPWDLQARVSAFAKLFFVPSLQLEASALGQGVEAGFDFRFPVFEIRGEAIDSPGGGACTKGDEYELALRLRTSYAFEIKFTAGRIKSNDQKVDITLGTSSYPLSTICKGFHPADIGEDPAASGTATLPAPSGGTTTPPSNGGGANTCTNKGKAGTCISKSECSSSGGTSTANLCPNDPNGIQCCTKDTTTPSTPNPCTAEGLSGECIATDACSSKGGKSTKNKCPNDPNGIQCCTKGTTTPATPNTCKVGSISGQCISTDACSSKGGKSTKNKCLDDPDGIQCCTTETEAPAAPNTCTAEGKSGTCIPTAQCASSNGKSTKNKCPDDPDDVQCCTPQAEAEDPPATSSSCGGDCIDTGVCKADGGKSTPNKCPGGANIQCCTFPTCKNGSKSGLCRSTDSCKGTSTPNLCPGAANIQCCT